MPMQDRGRRREQCPNWWAHNASTACANVLTYIDPPNPVEIQLGMPNIYCMLYGDPNDDPAEVERLREILPVKQ